MEEESIKDTSKAPSEIFFSWIVDEYDTHQRTIVWYAAAGLISFFLLIFAVFTKNFLFAVIIIIAALIFVLRDNDSPEKVRISIVDEGLMIGQKFYDFDDFKNFAVVHKPSIEVKNLYFEFKNPIRHRLSIPLEGTDPLQIRKILLKYLPEDLERTDPPLSEQLSKKFRL
jgi:hypothetical protein